MVDDMMEAPAQAPEREREGVPGAEVLGLAGNAVGWALVALGGLWVWIAAVAAALAAGGLWWRHERKRRHRGHASGSGASGRRGTGRSLGLGPSGRGSSGRSARGRGLFGLGRGAGRGSGRAASGAPTGRGRRSGSRKGTGPDATGKAGRRGLFGRGRKAAGPDGSRTGRGSRSAARRAKRAAKAAAKDAARVAAPTGRGGRGGRVPGRRRSKRGWTAPDARRGDTKLLPNKRTARPTVPGPDKRGPKPTAKPSPANPGTKGGSKPPPAAPTTTTPRAPIPHPHRNPNTAKHKEGLTIMGQFGRMWRQHSEEELSAANRYDPETMPDYYTDLQELITAFQNQAAALGKMSAITQADLPVDTNIAEYIAQLQSLMHTIAEGANETVGQFLKHHDADMARHNAPRRNEKKWNVQ